MKEYINEKIKKNGIWYYILLGLSTIYILKIGIYNVKLDTICIESVMFAIWAFLMLFPLISEMEFLGVKVKREVQKETNEIKKEMRQQITILQNQILEVNSSSFVNNNVKIQNNSFPSQEQIEESMNNLKQVKDENTSGEYGQRTNYYDKNEIKIEKNYVKMLEIRYSLENKIRLKAEEMNYSLSKYKSALDIIELFRKDGKIEDLLYNLIVQVIQITNRIVHGQEVDKQYIIFVVKIYPDIVNMIKNLK